MFNMNLKEAVDLFLQAYYANNVVDRAPQMSDMFLAPNHPLRIGRLPKSSFYCGITNNLQRRMNEHNSDALEWVESKTVDDAIALESELGKLGFDIGEKPGNGASDDSVFVYIYKKEKGITKEHIQ